MNYLDGRQCHVGDVWLCTLISLLIYISAPFVLSSFLKALSKPLSPTLIGLIGVMLSNIVPILYFAFRYGPVTLSDLFPKITEVPVLFGALVVVFVSASLGLLGGGWRTGISDELRVLEGPERFSGYFLVIILGPLLEETFFRKYVLEILRYRYPVIPAVFITVALETVFHLGYLKHGIMSLIRIFCYLLFFTLVYLKSRLGVSILAHCLLNGYITTLAI
jgi:membrane protease YdiL (CAAX protease family)